MERREILGALGTVPLVSGLSGCAGDVLGTAERTTTDSSSTGDATLRKTTVDNGSTNTQKVGIEAIQNHGNQVATGLETLGPSRQRSYDRQWPPNAGDYSVVLHVPTLDAYDLVTFRVGDESHWQDLPDTSKRWESDVHLTFRIESDGQIAHEITEVSR
jgi:hypothetical protein